MSYLAADRKPANFYEYEKDVNFNHRHIIDISRINISAQQCLYEINRSLIY